MAGASETFESGANGAAVTSTALGLIVGSATETYSTEQAAHGTRSMKIVQANQIGYIENNFTASAVTRYFRQYLYLSANPAASCNLLTLYSGATMQGHVRITSTGTVQLRNTASTQVGTPSAALPLNQWSRIETMYVPNGSSVVRVFAGNAAMESTTPTATITGAVGGTGTVSQALIGPSTSTNWTTYHDSVAWSDVGWLGPAGISPFSGWGLPL